MNPDTTFPKRGDEKSNLRKGQEKDKLNILKPDFSQAQTHPFPS